MFYTQTNHHAKVQGEFLLFKKMKATIFLKKLYYFFVSTVKINN